jgi:predicted neuraminidase
MIVERNDGRLWLIARTDALAGASIPPTGKVGLSESFSSDGGRTWTVGQPSKIPNVNARFFVRRLKSGKLLLVKNNPPLDVGWLADPSVYNRLQKRSHLTAYLSDDDGATWYGGLMIDDRISVSYPDGVQAPDGRIFLVYDFNRRTDKEILLAIFTEEDVAAKKIVDRRSALRLLVNKATGKPKSV